MMMMNGEIIQSMQQEGVEAKVERQTAEEAAEFKEVDSEIATPADNNAEEEVLEQFA